MIQETLDKYGIRSLADVLNDPVPGFLFDGLFRDHSITVLEAPAHRGKSMLMLDMAICLDLELPLFGRFPPIRGRDVFILGCDAPSWDYRLQTQKLLIGHGIPPESRKQLGIHGVFKRKLNIMDPLIQAMVEEWRKVSGASVLMIDSHRASHNFNENDSTQMKLVWDVLCDWRDRGWSIIMTHHIGKLSEQVQQVDVHSGRGSSVIADSADFKYVLSKPNRSANRIAFTCTKGRGSGGEDDEISGYEMLYVDSDEYVNGRKIKGIKLVVETGADLILKLLANGPLHRSEIEKQVMPTLPNPSNLKRYVDNRIQDLRKLGQIDTDGRGTWHLVSSQLDKAA